MQIIEELEILLGQKLYASSLILAFMIPDICAAISSENGESTKNKYKTWFKEYMKKYERHFNGDNAWNYRCALLHQGKLKHPKSDYSSVYFTISQNIKFHNCIAYINKQKYYICDIEYFCRDVIGAYKNWHDVEKNKINYKRNMADVVKIYRSSLGNIIKPGIPVLS
ncbi:MAG: hypothetical protein AABX65_01090 [Nanoarchaeota archaeon]